MSENKEKIMDVFFDNPTRGFYLREIARIVKLNPNTILNITRKLVKEELIKREKKRHMVEFSTNFESRKFKQLKKISNLRKIYDSSLLDFLVKQFSPEAISVIGSYSLGADLKNSDVDIVVITKKKYHPLNLASFEEKLGRKIHLLIMDYSLMSNEFYTNLINGIVLYGFVRKR